MKLRYLLLLSIIFLLLGCEQKESKPKEQQVVIREPDPSEFGYADTPPDPEIMALKKRYTKMDERLKAYDDAKYWFRDAYKNGASSYNLGVLYALEIKDYKEAWYWFRTSWNLENHYSTAVNLGNVHEKLNENKKSLKWYQKAWDIKETGKVANNIGFLYMEKFKDDNKALEWYEIALEKEEPKVLSNLAAFYHERDDDVKAAAYSIAYLGFVPSKEIEFEKKVTLKFLRENFKLDDVTIKKGLELQKRMPELKTFFYGELFEKK